MDDSNFLAVNLVDNKIKYLFSAWLCTSQCSAPTLQPSICPSQTFGDSLPDTPDVSVLLSHWASAETREFLIFIPRVDEL